MARFVRLLIAIGTAYLLWVLMIYLAQDKIIYLGTLRSRPATDGPARLDVQQLWLEPAPGVRVEGWFLAGDGRTRHNPGPAVLFLHGNKHHIDDIWRFSLPYAKAGYSFLAVDYRGYGRSGGEPSQSELVSDCLAWFDLLSDRPEVEQGAIVVHGNSLGGALGIVIASQRQAAALILESTFTTIAELFPRLGVPAFLCRAQYSSAELITKVQEPILIVHGNADWIIPISHGRKLAAKVPHAVFRETESGHTNYEPEWEAIWEFLGGLGLPTAVGQP